MKLKNYNGLSKKIVIFGLLYIIIKWTIILCVGRLLYTHNMWRNELLYIIPIIGLTVLWIKRSIQRVRKRGEKYVN